MQSFAIKFVIMLTIFQTANGHKAIRNVFQDPAIAKPSKAILLAKFSLPTSYPAKNNHPLPIGHVALPLHSSLYPYHSLNIDVRIGTPARSFVMNLDFGGADFVLLGQQQTVGFWESFAGAKQQKMVDNQRTPRAYNPCNSRTYRNLSDAYNFTWYGTGEMASDFVQLSSLFAEEWSNWNEELDGPTPATAFRQGFALLNNSQADHFAPYEADGILGLRPGPQHSSKHTKSLMQEMVAQFGAPQSVAFWFESTEGKGTSLPEVLNSTVTFGSIDPEHCAAAESRKWKFSEAVDNQWQLHLDHIKLVNLKKEMNRSPKKHRSLSQKKYDRGAPLPTTIFNVNNSIAMIDPAYMLYNYAPKNELKRLASLLGSTETMFDGIVHVIPCNSTAIIHFCSEDGSLDVPLTPMEYIIPNFFDKCIFSFLSWDANEWLFGLKFFGRHCLQLVNYGESSAVGIGPILSSSRN